MSAGGVCLYSTFNISLYNPDDMGCLAEMNTQADKGG